MCQAAAKTLRSARLAQEAEGASDYEYRILTVRPRVSLQGRVDFSVLEANPWLIHKSVETEF